MITTVNNAAELATALKAAASGDTVLLSPGTYSGVSIAGINISGNVTVSSADPSSKAVVNGLNLTNCSGLTFQGLELTVTTQNGFAAQIASCQNLVFDRLYVHGAMDGNPATDGSGIFVRASQGVSVVNSEFEQLGSGFAHLDSQNLLVANSKFHDLRTDGVRGGGSQGVTISGNAFYDFYPVSGDHPDAIQFWTTGTSRAGSDIVIADNYFLRGFGGASQGVFIRDEVGGLTYSRITITGNLIAGGLYHGIAVADAADVTIKDNVVQGLSDYKSWILLDFVQNAVVTNNAANTFTFNPTVSGLTSSGNTAIPQASDAATAVFTLWTANRGASLASTAYANLGTGGGGPPQTIQGDALANKLVGGSGDDTVTGGGGNDTIADLQGSNYLRGEDGNDSLSGGSGFDDMNGNAGDDTLRGGAGPDWVVGGKDNDKAYGEGGNDIVYGNLGNDLCEGGDGDDLVRGGQGDDTVKGENGADWLSGDKGDDTLIGGAGADTFHSFGDAGVDRITDFSLSQGDRVLLDLGTSYTVSQVGADTVIDMVGGGQVILVGVSMSGLTGNWLVLG